MPKYTFECNGCYYRETMRMKRKDFDPEVTFDCPECSAEMEYQLPNSIDSSTYDTDKYLGKSTKKGVKEQLKKRMRKHSAKYEHHEVIDRHGLGNTEHLVDKVEKV